MKDFKIAVISTLSFFGIIALGILMLGGRDKFAMIGLTGFILAVLYFFIGFIALIPNSSRQVGKGMLLSAGIVLLIGIGVCSVTPFNMH